MTSRDTVPDVQIEPPETCEHEEFKFADGLFSYQEDVSVTCATCGVDGTIRGVGVDWS